MHSYCHITTFKCLERSNYVTDALRKNREKQLILKSTKQRTFLQHRKTIKQNFLTMHISPTLSFPFVLTSCMHIAQQHNQLLSLCGSDKKFLRRNRMFSWHPQFLKTENYEHFMIGYIHQMSMTMFQPNAIQRSFACTAYANQYRMLCVSLEQFWSMAICKSYPKHQCFIDNKTNGRPTSPKKYMLCAYLLASLVSSFLGRNV